MDPVYLCVLIAAILAFSAVALTFLWAATKFAWMCIRARRRHHHRPHKERPRVDDAPDTEGKGEVEAAEGDSDDGGFANSDEGDIVFSPLRSPPAAAPAPAHTSSRPLSWLRTLLRPAPAPATAPPPPSPHLLVVTDPHYSPDAHRARSR
jgi:Ni/Co efflux regulator RcnB